MYTVYLPSPPDPPSDVSGLPSGVRGRSRAQHAHIWTLGERCGLQSKEVTKHPN